MLLSPWQILVLKQKSGGIPTSGWLVVLPPRVGHVSPRRPWSPLLPPLPLAMTSA